VSQKGRLRRLDAGVRWLETEGTYLRITGLVKSLEMLRDIADRADVDPAFAAEWKEIFPSIVLPPPRRKAAAPRPKPEPAPAPEPAPSVASQTPPPEVEPPRSQPSPPAIEPRPAPVVPVKDVPVMVAPVMEKAPPRPPDPPDPPAPMPGMPVSPPSPDMEIRPVQWRQRGPQDYYEEEDDSYGRCITEYDVLRDEYDDDS
jgi:hypothetical protein